MTQSLIQKLKEKINDSQWPEIEKAINLAKEAHKDQKRLTGENYVNHPLRTAITLADLRLGTKTLIAAILHDVYEDTPISLQEIRKRFGKDVAFLVEGVSKLGKLKYRGGQRQAESLRKLFMVMAEDIRVILIKLADRLDNLQTLYVLPPEKAKRIAMETIEIYAPIAYRLGMGELKGELEDAAFLYAYPEEYQWLMHQVKEEYKEREKYLKKVKPILKKELKKEGVNFLEIHSRPKHYYSLYKKLQRYDMDISKIYDLVDS
jgi:GTP pyrophosphokinase